ncbi:MAG TPA: hypothetical protein VFZ24_00375 [Longimicrobiales bacterium]
MIEAVVQVGTSETRYLRCGRGQNAVVVLAEKASERIRLMREIPDGCSVIAPVPDALPEADAAAFDAWLRGVIDGLGLDTPRIVLSPGMAWLAGYLDGVS